MRIFAHFKNSQFTSETDFTIYTTIICISSKLCAISSMETGISYICLNKQLKNMKKLIAVASFAAVLLASCTPKSSTAATPVASTSTAEQIAQGKTIFENSCGRCHKLPNPASHTSVQWVGIMNSMAPKAKLTDEQHQWVYDYIVSAKK